MLFQISWHYLSAEGTNPSVLHKLQLSCMMSTWIPANLIEYVVKQEYRGEEGEVRSLLNFATVLPQMFKEQWERLTSMGNGGLSKSLYVPYVYHLLL